MGASDKTNRRLAIPAGTLIVSCQAEGDDPFNRPDAIALFARAAAMGGAGGIRACGCENIRAIRAEVELPLIGLAKDRFADGSVLITPDFADIDRILDAGAGIVALDATGRSRPNGLTGEEFLRQARARYDVPLLADVSSLEEAFAAAEAGADFVAPTLHGHTPNTRDASPPDWTLLELLVRDSSVPVIMEGGIWTPQEAARALSLGAWAVVVGTAITRPRLITRRFVEAMKSAGNRR